MVVAAGAGWTTSATGTGCPRRAKAPSATTASRAAATPRRDHEASASGASRTRSADAVPGRRRQYPMSSVCRAPAAALPTGRRSALGRTRRPEGKGPCRVTSRSSGGARRHRADVVGRNDDGAWQPAAVLLRPEPSGRLLVLHGVAQRPDPADLHRHLVPGLEPQRWLPEGSDPARCAGEEQVAGAEPGEL